MTKKKRTAANCPPKGRSALKPQPLPYGLIVPYLGQFVKGFLKKVLRPSYLDRCPDVVHRCPDVVPFLLAVLTIEKGV